MIFKEEKLLDKLPYPQVDDPTNCVLYVLMNLFGDYKTFEPFMKTKEGHGLGEEIKVWNECKHLWTNEDIKLFPQHLASNGGNLYDGLTIGQLKSALEYWDYANYECADWFSPIFVTVASRFNWYGRHQVMLLYDGAGGSNAKMILCDPQIERFVRLEGIHELIAFYQTIMELDIVCFVDDEERIKTMYFQKDTFRHLPVKTLNEKDEDDG